MNFTLKTVVEVLLLVTALSLDAFVASFAYGSDHIKIPFSSFVTINAICVSFLGLSLVVGNFFSPFISPDLTKTISFWLMFLLGLVKLFDSTIKSYINKHKQLLKKFTFQMFRLNFILTVYADPKQADEDNSRRLSAGEAVSLAIALSIDGLAVGFGAALGELHIPLVLLCATITNMLAVAGGAKIGSMVAKATSLDFSWLSGLLLIILALLKVMN